MESVTLLYKEVSPSFNEFATHETISVKFDL